MKTKLFLSICLCAGMMSAAYAQQNTLAAAGKATGATGSVSYAVGQVNYITATGSGGSVSGGVQLPFDVYVLSGIEQPSVQINAAVYPNPAAELLVLEAQLNEPMSLRYTLHTATGQVLQTAAINDPVTQIQLSGLASGSYILSVANEQTIIRSFQVVKY